MPATRKNRLPAAPVYGYVCQCREPHRQSDENAVEVDMYLRVSEDKRLGGVERLAVDRQTALICKMCGERNMRIVRVWTDNDLSATSGVYRPAFEGTLLSDQTRVIVTWHTDRYVRLTKELERVIDRGLLVHAVEAGSHDLSTVTGQATAKTVTTWAQHEGQLKAVRQKAQNRQAALSGEPRWWTRVPFGYNRDKSQNPAQAVALKAVYEALLMGATVGSQVRYLNDLGLYSNTGAKWQHGSLRHVLMAHRNAGIRTYTTILHKGTPREEKIIEELGAGTWEPIVSEETYRAVVSLLSDPARFSGGPRTGKEPLYMLTGLALCGVCGGTIKVQRRGGKDVPEEKRYAYYTCREGRCVNHRVDFTDSVVLRGVIEKLSDPDFQHAWGGQDSVDVQPAILEKKQIELAVKEMMEDRALGLISRTDMINGKAKAEKRLREIDSLLISTGSSTPLMNMLRDTEYLWQEFGNMTIERSRQVIAAVCETITLLPRGNSPALRAELIEISPRMPESMEVMA